MKKIFLVRHADYSGGGSDPSISENGREQALALAEMIKETLSDGDVTIWTSSASRASGTAQIIKQEMQLAELKIKEKLWSDNSHQEDFDWLKSEIDAFEGDNLIIVSHLEYVRRFPSLLGYGRNDAGYAQGVLINIQDNTCINF